MRYTTQLKINLACGDVYVAGDDWINIDYGASNPTVQRADLLGRLPLPNDGAALVYSSHFLEHIPRNQVSTFLAECYRILAPGGVLRLVLPDMENLCRSYLEHLERGEHDKANFLVLEMIDQCVRRESGGELGRLYRDLKSAPDLRLDLIAFVRERTGEALLSGSPVASFAGPWNAILHFFRRIRALIERVWTRAVLRLLPKAFRAQNVSLAAVGERHHWLWDFHQLRTALKDVGFVDIMRCNSTFSCFDGFPFQPLDVDTDGRPRKGAESMYVEARKPG